MSVQNVALCIAVHVLAPVLVRGDVGTAIRRSSATHSKAVLPIPTPLTKPLVLPLTRVGVKLADAQEASFYVGEISVGFPAKTLTVVFDTASGNVILPHRACKDSACLEHRRYSPWESLTAMDVNTDGEAVQAGRRIATGKRTRDAATIEYTQSDLGAGDLKAVFVRDTICMGAAGDVMGHACTDLAVLAAIHMDERPFRHMPSDGVIGLGLTGLAAGPLCSFLERMLPPGSALPQFGLAFGAEHGELHLGGHDPARLAGPLHWFPVDHPDAGLWQVSVQAVRVGNVTVDDCRQGCHGVVDSAVSRLGVQASKLHDLQSRLASAAPDQIVGCRGPSLTFELGGFDLTLEAKDYTDGNCAPLLGKLDLEEPEWVGVYAFGSTLLRRYYAAFDWQHRRLGFAPLAGEPGSSTSTVAEALGGMLMI